LVFEDRECFTGVNQVRTCDAYRFVAELAEASSGAANQEAFRDPYPPG
jgi:hypothetical protein